MTVVNKRAISKKSAKRTHLTQVLENRLKNLGKPDFENTGTPRILCVDDDPDLQTSIELRMRKYDVDIERAFHGMQGVVEASKILPDLILMDLAMPYGSGEYLLEVIRRNAATSEIPIIVLTGMRDQKVKNQVLSMGADAYLNKPVQFDELVHQISRFIDLRECDQEGHSK